MAKKFNAKKQEGEVIFTKEFKHGNIIIPALFS